MKQSILVTYIIFKIFLWVQKWVIGIKQSCLTFKSQLQNIFFEKVINK